MKVAAVALAVCISSRARRPLKYKHGLYWPSVCGVVGLKRHKRVYTRIERFCGGICMFGDTFDISVSVSSFVDFARGSCFYRVLHSHGWRVTWTEFCRRGVYRVEASRSVLTGRSRAVGSLTSSLCNAGDSPLDRKRRINSAYSDSERGEVYFVTNVRFYFVFRELFLRLAAVGNTVSKLQRVLSNLLTMREVQRQTIEGTI